MARIAQVLTSAIRGGEVAVEKVISMGITINANTNIIAGIKLALGNFASLDGVLTAAGAKRIKIGHSAIKRPIEA